MASLTGRVALVVGGSRGIGRAIAAALGAAGCQVVLVSRSASAVEEAAAELRDSGVDAVGIAGDASVPADLQAALRAVDERWGRLDILVNNVGGGGFVAPIARTRVSGFSTQVERNLLPVFNGLHDAAELLSRSDAGCVLTIASTGALIPSPGLAYYGAAKAAVVSLSRTAALEWAPLGIRVNVIAPGWVRTDLSAPQHEDPLTSAAIVETIPLGRWAEPEDVADAAVFLCSPAARYITGVTLVVDGGLTLRGTVGA